MTYLLPPPRLAQGSGNTAEYGGKKNVNEWEMECVHRGTLSSGHDIAITPKNLEQLCLPAQDLYIRLYINGRRVCETQPLADEKLVIMIGAGGGLVTFFSGVASGKLLMLC